MTAVRGSIARPDDHVIVLFGATGDLARRKLLPGLFHLAVAGLLPRRYRIIGTARRRSALSDADFRQRVPGRTARKFAPASRLEYQVRDR